MIDLSHSRLPPYKHQLVGIEKIVTNPYFFIQDEMGSGKTKQTIDAAQVLATMGLINRVVVIAPASVRAVWFDPELGELAKHLWAHFPCTVTEYHGKERTWNWFTQFEGKRYNPFLNWTITNYDFIGRSKDRLRGLKRLCNEKTFLVLDESSSIKNWKALQTKACEELRAECGRVLLLNGTPISNGLGDLYSQAHMMNPAILGYKTYFHFRSAHAVMGGFQNKQVLKWINVEKIQTRLAPYVLRRLKAQCIDLPAKLPSVIRSVTLDEPTWKLYKEMRDDMVAWLSNTEVCTASQAMVKAIRLAQITSGFVGGIEKQELEFEEAPEFAEMKDGIDNGVLSISSSPDSICELPNQQDPRTIIKEVGREKLDDFLDFVLEQLENDPNLKLLVWCRFRHEVRRTTDEINRLFPHIMTGQIWGGQKREERDVALRLLDPRTMPVGPAVVLGTPSSGSMGLNLTGAHVVIYLSNDFSLKTRLQSEDRVHRPGQTFSVSYYDSIACGPDGQKTIDHLVVKALLAKEDLANMTTSAWLDALSDE